jgi:hypothetical protein
VRDERVVFEGLLTRRELDVLRLLAEGATNRAVADALVISSGTVKFHVNADHAQAARGQPGGGGVALPLVDGHAGAVAAPAVAVAPGRPVGLRPRRPLGKKRPNVGRFFPSASSARAVALDLCNDHPFPSGSLKNVKREPGLPLGAALLDVGDVDAVFGLTSRTSAPDSPTPATSSRPMRGACVPL